MKYTGKKCVLCEQEFTENDDVVVCPECGSPHHRECYKRNGKCENEILHKENFDWNAIFNDSIKKNNISENESEDENRIVINLSENMSVEDMLRQPYFAKSMYKADETGCTLREILDFVHTNVLYYVPVFMRIRNYGRSASFNLLCFISPHIYFASRKMWFWAILTAIISVILIVPVILSGFASPGNPAALPEYIIDFLQMNANTINSFIEIFRGIDLFMRIMLCLFGNRLYYNFAVKSIKRIKAKYNEDISKEQLISAGGINVVNVFVIIMILFVMVTIAIIILKMLLYSFV